MYLKAAGFRVELLSSGSTSGLELSASTPLKTMGLDVPVLR